MTGVYTYSRRVSRCSSVLSLLACLLVLFSGCSLGMDIGKKLVIPENECRTDRDCGGEDSLCDTENNICVACSPNVRSVLIEVVPRDPGDGSNLPSQYYIYEGETNRKLDEPLALRDTIVIKGIVKWGEETGDYRGICEIRDDQDLCVIDAKLELTVEGDFPESVRQTVTAKTGLAEPNTVKDGGDVDDFRIVTVPGVYSLWVVPEAPFDTYLPPQQVFDRSLIDESQTLIIRYDSLETMSRIDGLVLRSDISPLNNIAIWAVDPDTGRRISSIARVDSENNPLPGGAGEATFRLFRLPSVMTGGIGEYFTIAISSEEESPRIPNVKFGPFTFSELDILDGDPDDCVNFEAAPLEEYRLVLPPIGVRVKYEATVEGVNPDGTVQSVEGVRAKFMTDDVGGENTSGSYEVFGTTNYDGQIVGPDETTSGIWLIEGDYTVTLYPPLNSDYESSKITFVRITEPEGGGPLRGQVYQLDGKRLVVGQILKMADGEAAGIVTAEAYPVSPFDSPTGTYALPRFNMTQSDELGMYDLPLDSGLYDLLFMPDPSSNFPWTWVNNVEVRESDVTLTIELSDPSAFQGTVVDAAGEPVGNAEVKVYDIVYSPVPEEPPLIRRIGKTATKSDGGFICLIAP